MKKYSLGIILIIINLVAIIFNIEAVIWGGDASLFGFLASFGVVAIWVLNYGYILKNKKYKLTLYSTVFWSLTLLTALITLYANVTEVSGNIGEAMIAFTIPLVVIFLAPLNGLGFMVKSNNIITLAIIIIVASGFILSGSRCLVKDKNKNL